MKKQTNKELKDQLRMVTSDFAEELAKRKELFERMGMRIDDPNDWEEINFEAGKIMGMAAGLAARDNILN